MKRIEWHFSSVMSSLNNETHQEEEAECLVNMFHNKNTVFSSLQKRFCRKCKFRIQNQFRESPKVIECMVEEILIGGQEEMKKDVCHEINRNMEVDCRVH